MEQALVATKPVVEEGSKKRKREDAVHKNLVLSNPHQESLEMGHIASFPEHWKFAKNHSTFRAPKIQLVQLLPSDPEFGSVSDFFYETLPCRECANIVCIEQIQNVKQFFKYSIEHAAIIRETKFSKLPYPVERMLWHGTSLMNLQSLLTHGFDKGYSRRSMYGKGFYFSRKARIAGQEIYAKTAAWDIFHPKIMDECRKPQCHQLFCYVNQAKKTHDSQDEEETANSGSVAAAAAAAAAACVVPEMPPGCKVLVLCRVLTGKVQMLDDKNNMDRLHPSPSFHSVGSLKCEQKNIDDMDYMVSFNPEYIYPEYICYFKANTEYSLKHRVFYNLDKISQDSVPVSIQPQHIPKKLTLEEEIAVKERMSRENAKKQVEKKVVFDQIRRKTEDDRCLTLLSWNPSSSLPKTTASTATSTTSNGSSRIRGVNPLKQ